MIAPLPDDPVLEPACGTAKILLSAVGGRPPGSDAGGISALMLSEIPKKERAIRRTGAFPSRSRPSPVHPMAHCRRYGIHAFFSWHRAMDD
jgi:hypothetical protein